VTSGTIFALPRAGEGNGAEIARFGVIDRWNGDGARAMAGLRCVAQRHCRLR